MCRHDVKKPLGVAASPGNQKQWGEMHHCVQGTRNEWVSSAATTKALPARRCPERGWVRLTPALGRAGRVLSPATVSLPCGDGRAGTQTRGGDSVRASLRTRACLVQLPSFPQVSGGLMSSTWHVRQRPQATAEMQPRTELLRVPTPGFGSQARGLRNEPRGRLRRLSRFLGEQLTSAEASCACHLASLSRCVSRGPRPRGLSERQCCRRLIARDPSSRGVPRLLQRSVLHFWTKHLDSGPGA